MFKTISSTLIVTSLILFSLIADVAGVYLMIASAVNHTNDFMTGFTLFSLGTLILLGVSIAYLATKAQASLNLIANALADFIDHTLDKEAAQVTGGFHVPSNPLMDLLKGKFPEGTFGSTTINVSSVDEEGNISPLMTKTFDNPEDFFKHRDKIFKKAFGENKNLENMSIEELKMEEKKAVESQNFELAASIVSLIKEKENKSK